MEELELVQATKHGDLIAFNDLILKYQGQVFNLSHRILGDHDMVEDIAQDTFIHAFQKIHQFKGGSFRAWLLKIVTSLCYDEIRTWRCHSHLPLEPIDRENNTNKSLWWIKDPGPLPEDAAEMSELRSMLEHGLNQLLLKFHTVVTQVDVHQLDYREVSLITGIPIGTVKSRLSRGRKQLGIFLQDTAMPYLSESSAFNMMATTPPYQPK